MRVAAAAGVVAILLGSCGLTGWLFDIAVLKSVLPGFVTMKANTAVSFLVAGISLRLQSVPDPPQRNRSIARVCALFAAAVGVLTLTEYVLGINLGMDELLFRAPPGEVGTSHPGRMSFNAAVCFALLGTTLAFPDGDRFRSVPRSLAIIALLLAFVAVVGYVYGVRALFGVAGYTSMSIPTAAGFSVLAIGALAMRPRLGVVATLAQDNQAGATIRRLLPTILLTPIVVGWLTLKGEHAGFYGAEFGLAIMVTVSTVVLTSVALLHARAQGTTELAGQESLRDERFLFALGESLRSVRDAGEVLREVSRRLGQHLGVSRCFFTQIDLTNQSATIEGDYHLGLPSIAATRSLSLYSAEVIATASAGHIHVSEDTKTDPRTAGDYEKGYVPIGIRSRVVVPLLREGRWVSTLVASSHEPRGWQSREVSLVQTVGERAWLWVERLRVEEALQQRERDLAVTMNSIGDAIITTDEAGRTVRMNPVAERLTGWSLPEASARPLHEIFRIVDEDTRAPVESPVERVLRVGTVVGLGKQTILVSRDGSERPIADSGAPIRDSEGAVRGVVIVFRDASVERAAERALRESEARKSAMLNSAFDAIVSMDHRGTVVEFNPAAEKLFGYRREELIGKPMAEHLVPPSLRDAHHRGLARYLETGEGRALGKVLELLAMRRDGSEFPAEVAITRVQGQDPPLFTAFARDITERKRAAELFRLALETAPTGMIMADDRGRMVLVNAQVERLFGYARHELVGRPVEMLMPERFRGRHSQHRATFAAEPPTRLTGAGRDLYGLRKDGSEVPIEIGLNPLRTSEGAFVLSSIVDITERRRAERDKETLLEQLRTLNADLEERVRGRTAELTATLKEREVLLQEVHHRVKNNLQVIASLVNMQIRQVTDASTRVALEECQTRVQAIALIHEKLYQSSDYARIPFSEYARSLAGNIFHATGVSPASVELNLKIQTLALAVDKAIPCGLILNELITNALKHAFPNERRGAIQVELCKLSEREVLLSVADDGVGLSADFDIERSNSLGMQLVSTLVEQLDGRLEIARPGGTMFSVIFPSEGLS